jgi:hypothetical protein
VLPGDEPDVGVPATRSSSPWGGRWSPHVDAVLRLPGAEMVSLARERGIPVYPDVAIVPTAS